MIFTVPIPVIAGLCDSFTKKELLDSGMKEIDIWYGEPSRHNQLIAVWLVHYQGMRYFRLKNGVSVIYSEKEIAS